MGILGSKPKNKSKKQSDITPPWDIPLLAQSLQVTLAKHSIGQTKPPPSWPHDMQPALT